MIDVFFPRPGKIIPATAIFILFFVTFCFADDIFPFRGVVNQDGINMRSDSTVNAAIIGNAQKGRELVVVLESYGWYKVKMPQDAPSYINRELTVCIDESCRDARVTKDKVRVRLQPDKNSPVLGIARKDEVVHILASGGGWYKIQPVENSYAWIHKKFIKKSPAIIDNPLISVEDNVPPASAAVEIPVEQLSAAKETETQPQTKEQGEVTITGIVAPYGKVFGRKATHKLISENKEIFLLKKNKKELDSFNYRKVRVSGTKLVLPRNQKFPVIEVTAIEEIK